MTNNDIIKIIDFIDKNEIDKARDFLKTQLVKGTDKKSYNILSLVKKIILSKETVSRPVLRSIMHCKSDNKQCICDGFVGIKWKQNESGLDALAQTASENSIDLDAIMGNLPPIYKLTDNDKFIIDNIDKFHDLALASKIDKKEKGFTTYIFGKYFDVNIIKNVIKICLAYDSDFANTNFYSEDILYRPVQLENDNVKAIILPVRTKDDEERDAIQTQTQKIIDMIKGN